MVTHPNHATYDTGPVACDRVPDPEEHRRCLAATDAVARFKTNARLMWRDWIKITGLALVICRQTARLRARDGGRKETHMNHLLKFYELDALGKNDRAALLWIMDRLDKVEAWRELQPNKDALNNPQVVFSAFKKSATRHDEQRKKLGDIALLTKRIAEQDARIAELETEKEEIKKQLKAKHFPHRHSGVEIGGEDADVEREKIKNGE